MRDVKIPNWLNGLPLAPEFRPTDTEFADPIAYISKIEKEASAFGICKVIPPLPKPSKKYVFSNLNKSLSKCPELGSDVDLLNVCSKKKLDGGDRRSNGGEGKAVFTTRQQELGQSGKRKKSVQKQSPPIYKQVWQSGEVYTLEQFESKSKVFARSQLATVKQVSAPVIETLFWEAASEKPIYVEYANDVPGSGFGEPDGSACRRTRTPNRNSQNDSQSKNNLSEAITSNDESRGASHKFNPSCFSNIARDHNSRLSREKSSGHGNEIEGTSGQKLSNSPWNLQVIARSPGSLTRFMPDDIPGVTSPMVYIGMLFSWFAWHVEDHELHSLNFLHTGSSKTWYAVPGDYALTFEEVIRNQAYGGNIDHLAALTLLGEKTTLLSPEVIVASGIPCCRLVQNPGEFVVTFPRAYHVGFSHGFNCGEAANFGTPKWLTVAKEAAVRRAVMNHLPMLSHQQLLYLLTMSFIPRVPRYLLPGVRGSRLKDRQKEERELSVKKAFIEDILSENCKLTHLLQKNSSYRVVQWDLESPPSSPKGSELVNSITTTIKPKENHSTETGHKHELSDHNLYLEYVGDFHDDADLSSEFQTDSGALPCVACGLLGFPFMSVVRPSKEAYGDILSANPVKSSSSLFLDGMVDISVSDAMNNQDMTIKERISSACERNDTMTTKIVTGREINLTEKFVQASPNMTKFSSDVEDELNASSKFVQEPTGAYSNLEKRKSMFCLADSLLKDLPSSSIKKFIEGPKTYLRPRIFCLEHAIEVEELLRGKGGADVLVICHSDFKKIKGHIAAVAEEIGNPFNYQEVFVDNASPEDLKLINIAIDYEGQDECQEDWTSKVKTNLRHCLKLSKDFPSERLQHALTLKGLCFDKAPSESSVSWKWKSKKFRSKRMKLDQSESKSSEITLITDGGAKSDRLVGGKQVKLMHYVRRFKSKNSSSIGASMISEDSTNISLVGCDDKDRHIRIADDLGKDEKTGRGSSEMIVLVSREASEGQEEDKCIVETRDLSEIAVLSQVNTGLVTAEPVIENITSQIGNNMLKELTVNDKACDSATSDSQMQQGIKLVTESRFSETSSGKFSETSAGSPEVTDLTALACQSAGSVQVEKENQMTEAICSRNVDHDLVISGYIGGQHNIHDDGDASLKEVSDPTASEVTYADITNIERSDEQIEKPLVDSINMNIVADGCANLEREIHVVCTSTNVMKEKKASVSVEFTPSEKSCSISSEEIIDFPSESCAAENMDIDNLEPQPRSVVKNIRKRKPEADLLAEDGFVFDGFIRSPCEGLRPRTGKDTVLEEKPVTKMDKGFSEGPKKMDRESSEDPNPRKNKIENRKASHKCLHKIENRKASHKCDVDGCKVSFKTNQELRLHKRNQCPHEGCRKKFSSHKNAVIHLRVHDDDRPLKCPWKDCDKSFKWAWARTEHIRVHTGERPYRCQVEGCGLTFRFVSDYSRHRRKTGHYVN